MMRFYEIEAYIVVETVSNEKIWCWVWAVALNLLTITLVISDRLFQLLLTGKQ